jgi:glyoxylase-like metal-dependent hydrolase (beta-lactamase superfamily II)
MAPIEVTGVAQRRSWDTPDLPDVEQVRPGLWSVPVPLPNNPLRYVLVYLLEIDHGLAVIDTGWSTEEAWAALVAGMTVAGYEPADVRAILVTHIHPDHYGLAGRLREASGAWIALHPADAALSRPATATVSTTSSRAWLRSWSTPAFPRRCGPS